MSSEWLAIAGGEEDEAIFERLPHPPRHGQSLKVTHAHRTTQFLSHASHATV